MKSSDLLVQVLLGPWKLALGFRGGSGPWTESPETFSFLLALPAEGADPSSSRLPAVSLMEDPPQRLRWQAHLEFTHNHDVGDLTWDKIAASLPRSEKLRSLVLAGIPHSMRPQVRPRRPGHRGPQRLRGLTKD